ncbi:hypothetical protein PYCC9005_002905 [Savitreella phatthalungensis]
MSRLSQTGTNNIPLGRNRLAGEAPGGPRSGGYGNDTRPPPPSDYGRQAPKKRRNRWDDASPTDAAAGMTTAIRACMTIEQLEAYALHIRLEDISHKLRIGDVLPPERLRSPSPPPVYDNYGKRTNTADARYRKKLEEERHKLVERALKTIPDYKPPADYRRPAKTQDKIYVPVNDYPEVNFIGLLIGPRGNTLKTMEQKSGAKIAIRGKGSVKEGKGRADLPRGANENLDDDLHCVVQADTEEKVNHAIKLIEEVITTAASTPEAQNEHKRKQLRDLAILNGTLRDDENQICQNCGQLGHRKYACPNKPVFQASAIICHKCGGAGHMARDCRAGSGANNAPLGAPPGMQRRDLEYQSVMNDLGGRPGPSQEASAPWERPKRIEGSDRPWDSTSRGQQLPPQQSSQDSRLPPPPSGSMASMPYPPPPGASGAGYPPPPPPGMTSSLAGMPPAPPGGYGPPGGPPGYAQQLPPPPPPPGASVDPRASRPPPPQGRPY